MKGDSEFARPRHPIQVVATRTGLTMDVLRAWERRYEAVVPGRTDTGRRRYSDADIERLIMLKRAMAAGRSIGEIARLDHDALQSLLDEDQANVRSFDAAASSTEEDPVSLAITRCLSAIERLDGVALRGVIADVAPDISQSALIENVLAPVMTSVGEAWREGTLRIAHEHLATSTIQWFLGELTRRRPPHNAPTAVMATPVGQRHQVGIMLAAATAVCVGWKVVYLGADLPAEEIAVATERSNAVLIGLSVVYPSDDPALSSELAMLRRSVPPYVEIVLGGRSASAYSTIASGVGCEIVADLAEFRSLLGRIESRQ